MPPLLSFALLVHTNAPASPVRTPLSLQDDMISHTHAHSRPGPGSHISSASAGAGASAAAADGHVPSGAEARAAVEAAVHGAVVDAVQSAFDILEYSQLRSWRDMVRAGVRECVSACGCNSLASA